MKIVFLGTNGWYDTSTGNTTCIVIDSKSQIIILDAGNGIFKLSKYVYLDKPAYLFLSHFHLDHIVGLHIISKFAFKKGLFVCGMIGLESILEQVINAPFTIPLKEVGFETSTIELSYGENLLPFYVETLPLVHASTTLGFRFEIEGKTIAYCTDTGYCENAVKLARNADLLIAECAFKPGGKDLNWPHLNPETAAKIANESCAKMLALIHFDAEVYKTLKERHEAELKAKTIFNNVFATVDDMVIEI